MTNNKGFYINDINPKVDLALSEIRRFAEFPVLRDSGSIVFILTTGPVTTYLCAKCMIAELDAGKRVSVNIIDGNTKVRVAVVHELPDEVRDLSCSGCDTAIFDCDDIHYAGVASRLGFTLGNGNMVIYECPNCKRTDDLSSLVVGWCPVTEDGQFSTDEMENAEVLDGPHSMMRCGNCEHCGTVEEFSQTAV